MDGEPLFGAGGDDAMAYQWGAIFASPWSHVVQAMEQRAAAYGLEQDAGDRWLVWRRGGEERGRFVFLDDPSDIGAVRRVFNDDANVGSPATFVIVRQPDPSDRRGDVIFDIFLMSARSYLWHYHRVFTQPGARSPAGA